MLLLCSECWALGIDKFPPEPEKDKLVRVLVMFSKEGYFLLCQYKINEEAIEMDYQTVRPLERKGSFLVGKKFPRGYWYDVNQDGQMSDDEVLIDKAEDGLNGNEITFEQYRKIEELRKTIEEHSLPHE